MDRKTLDWKRRVDGPRMRNAKLRADLKAMSSHEALYAAADVIENVGRFETMRVHMLLTACPQVGRQSAWKMASREIDPATRLSDLHPIQRQLIAHQVRLTANRRKRLYLKVSQGAS